MGELPLAFSKANAQAMPQPDSTEIWIKDLLACTKETFPLLDAAASSLYNKVDSELIFTINANTSFQPAVAAYNIILLAIVEIFIALIYTQTTY